MLIIESTKSFQKEFEASVILNQFLSIFMREFDKEKALTFEMILSDYE